MEKQLIVEPNLRCRFPPVPAGVSAQVSVVVVVVDGRFSGAGPPAGPPPRVVWGHHGGDGRKALADGGAVGHTLRVHTGSCV